MSRASSRAARVTVISDLHLGGGDRPMMSRPSLLADFIDKLDHRAPREAGESLELVIAGDFIDFLAIPPHASWTPNPTAARAKLKLATNHNSFAPVFDALGRHIARGYRLTILLGNHDVELALPAVQDALLQRLNSDAHSVLFITDGRAYQIGNALIEHGNRYDDANQNDLTNLRAIASAHSRGVENVRELAVSAGSEIVTQIINPLKEKYPFIDLLQPAGELVALLVLALEPAQRRNIRAISRLLHGAYLERRNKGGFEPGATTHIARTPVANDDPELRSAFGDMYRELRDFNQQVASLSWLPIVFKKDGVAALLASGKAIPPERLHQIRLVMRKLLLGDSSAVRSDPTGPQAEAARRLTASGEFAIVVMGHTHHARDVSFPEGGRYLNTGTWVDRFRVPDASLNENSQTSDDALSEFLRNLCVDKRIPLPPTYVEFQVNRDKQVVAAELHELHS